MPTCLCSYSNLNHYHYCFLSSSFFNFLSSFRKYNATSARVLAIYVVLPLVMMVQEKFLATDVVNWVILVW